MTAQTQSILSLVRDLTLFFCYNNRVLKYDCVNISKFASLEFTPTRCNTIKLYQYVLIRFNDTSLANYLQSNSFVMRL